MTDNKTAQDARDLAQIIYDGPRAWEELAWQHRAAWVEKAAAIVAADERMSA